MATCKECIHDKICFYQENTPNITLCPYFKTADVVEVVRCKDCVNYCGFEHCNNGICDRDSVSKWAVYPDDFCSYGERRDT